MNMGTKSVQKIDVPPEYKISRGIVSKGWLHSPRLRMIPQWLAENAAVSMHYLFGDRCRNSFGVLMYHRIAARTPGVPSPTWNVTPDRFRNQMQGLLAKGFKPWPLRKVIEYHRQGQEMPQKTFVVTFDDGYEGVYRNAWPILKELHIPATIFIITGLLDTDAPMPFEDWPAAGSHLVPISSWRCISKAQCREIMEDGLIDLGTHTHSHHDFRNRPDAFCSDIFISIQSMQQWFGLMESTFAYPYGYAEPELVAMVKTTGLLCGLTAKKELIKPMTDPFTWGRMTVEQSDTAATLEAKLSGWYGMIYDLVHGLRTYHKKTPTGTVVENYYPTKSTRQATIQH
jgi:peptidoglycan/xylan/chitin deacetylase (PgdA/CDA1 family)